MISAVSTPVPEPAATVSHAHTSETGDGNGEAEFDQFFKLDVPVKGARGEAGVKAPDHSGAGAVAEGTDPGEVAATDADQNFGAQEEDSAKEAGPAVVELDPSMVISCLPMWQDLPENRVVKGEAGWSASVDGAGEGPKKDREPSLENGVALAAAAKPVAVRRAAAEIFAEKAATSAKPGAAPAKSSLLAPPAGRAKTPQSVTAIPPEILDGMGVAKEHPDMKEAPSMRSAKPAAAVFAMREIGGAMRPEMVTPVAANPTAAPARPRLAEPTPIALESLASTDSIATPLPHSAPRSATVDAPAALSASDPATVVQKIEQLVERIRTHDTTALEVRLPLREGGEVLVKLHLAQGEVRAIFRTESEGLRHALAASWTQFSQRANEGDVRLGSAVFQTPGAPNHADSFPQSSDPRGEQNFAQNAREPDSQLPPRASAKAVNKTAPSPANLASVSSLQIYA